MKKTPRFFTYFKNNQQFRLSCFAMIAGILVAVYACNFMTGTYKTAVTFFGALITVVASEKMSAFISQMGAEALAEREEQKKNNKIKKLHK